MAIINDYNELLKLFSQITATETASFTNLPNVTNVTNGKTQITATETASFTNALAYCKDKATRNYGPSNK